MSWADFWEMANGVAWRRRVDAGVKDPVHKSPEQVEADKAALRAMAKRSGMI